MFQFFYCVTNNYLLRNNNNNNNKAFRFYMWHPGVLGRSSLHDWWLLLNNRCTLHVKGDWRKKQVLKHFHIHVPYVHVYMNKLEDYDYVHSGYVHQLRFHVCFIWANCLPTCQMMLRIGETIDQAYMFGLCKGISPQNMALHATVPPFYQNSQHWFARHPAESVRWVTSLMIWWRVLQRSGGLMAIEPWGKSWNKQINLRFSGVPDFAAGTAGSSGLPQ